MADYLAQTKSAYEQFCKVLDDHEWHYKRHDEDLTVSCGARGDDLPMDMVVMFNPKQALMSIFSLLPFNIKEEKRVEAALAVCVANYGLVRGSFDYDISDGEIRFRMTEGFADSIISSELMYAMLMIACNTVDKYNDKFLCVSNGVMDLEAFVKWEQGEKN